MPLGGEIVDVADLYWIDTDTQDTSGVATAASGFVVNTEEITVWGRMAAIRLNVTCTAGITATSGNFTDVTMCTLAAPYLPARQQTFATNGNVGSVGYIHVDGRVRLANSDITVPPGAGIELGVTYLLAAVI
jgi:hypothetical protein